MGRPVGRTNMQPAAAASEQTAASAASSSEQQQAVSQPADSRVVLRGVALLYESPGGNQVDGLPPVPTLTTPPIGCEADFPGSLEQKIGQSATGKGVRR